MRVAVRLSPPLVSELLALLVDAHGLDVVIDVSTGTVEVDTDILVTAADLHPVMSEKPPRAVVVLGDPIAPGVARVISAGEVSESAVADLAEVADVVRALCTRPH